MTTPARAFCDLAEYLDLGELVAVGDAALRGVCSREDLDAALRRRADGRHRRILSRAMELLDPRAESPKETELRVLLIEAGFAPPVPNLEVFDEDGLFVARIDLAYREQRIALEYKGDHHRDRAQWQRDLARRRRLEALGWKYLTVTQTDLRAPAALFADLAAALAARLA